MGLVDQHDRRCTERFDITSCGQPPERPETRTREVNIERLCRRQQKVRRRGLHILARNPNKVESAVPLATEIDRSKRVDGALYVQRIAANSPFLDRAWALKERTTPSRPLACPTSHPNVLPLGPRVEVPTKVRNVAVVDPD